MHATASPSELSAPSPFVAARGGGSAMEDLIAGRWITKPAASLELGPSPSQRRHCCDSLAAPERPGRAL